MDERKVERVEVDGMELHVESVDEEDEVSRGPHTALPPRVETWRRRSVAGAVLTGFAFGLREALEPERQEAAIVVQVSGEPGDDLAVQAHVNEQQPHESVVKVRPWLLREAGQDLATGAVAGPLDLTGPVDDTGTIAERPARANGHTDQTGEPGPGETSPGR